MRVRYVRNSLDSLGIDYLAAAQYEALYRSNGPDGPSFDLGKGVLELGFEATVYAWVRSGPTTRYYIREPRHGCITHFAAPAFDIIDNRISRYWACLHELLPKGSSYFPLPAREKTVFAIREWIEEPRFLEYLVDERERELGIMNDMTKLMDAEFADE